MMKNSLFAALGLVGLVAAGAAAVPTPAAATGCGAWNNWCRPACGPWNRWCAAYYPYPGYSFYFGYGPKYWGHDRRRYAYGHHGKPGKYGKWNGGGHHGKHH